MTQADDADFAGECPVHADASDSRSVGADFHGDVGGSERPDANSGKKGGPANAGPRLRNSDAANRNEAAV
jgi:hypothetical protein